MSLYNSDSSAEYVTIIANCFKRMKRSTSRERERERQRRRRQQQQQQPPTVDRESQHSREMVLESQNSRSNCYFEDFGTDDYDYGDGNAHNNEQEGYADVEDNSTPQQTRRRLPRAQRRYNRKTILDEEWAMLLPKLRDAYFRGIGQNDIDITTLDPPATFECSCIVKKTATVVCIFKCGVRKHDISFCDNCPDGSRSLPVILLEKHLFSDHTD
ncbi:hypothetical protein BDC45DRAFT_289514 [Circinella umbellata]|nr:hypothetical protein BDC45DRAFT_289514 [Circinella umbellata]